MGMTLWIHTLEDREYSKDSDDHSQMHRHADALDAVSEAEGVRKLSEFIDYTDQEFNYDDVDDDDDGAELDPETDLAYGIDDMAWFEASEGLVSLRAVRKAVAAGGFEAADDDELDELLEELDDCIDVLEGPAARGAKFHFTLVE